MLVEKIITRREDPPKFRKWTKTELCDRNGIEKKILFGIAELKNPNGNPLDMLVYALARIKKAPGLAHHWVFASKTEKNKKYRLAG